MQMTKNIAIITGHHRGIGKAIAEHFNQANYLTIGIDQIASSAAAHDVEFDLSSIAHDPDKAIMLQQELVQLIPSKSNITLINNAAVQIVKPFDELDAADLSHSIYA